MSREFMKILDELEVDKGDLLYLHTSFSHLASLVSSPQELLRLLLDRIGSQGTLVLPSFAWNLDKSSRPWVGFDIYFQQRPPFDLLNTPANIGLVPEVFRQMPGVFRSASYWWSVCAIGPLAEHITKDQSEITHSFGPGSTFDILRLHAVKILGLGVTLNTTSLALLPHYHFQGNHCQKVFTEELLEGVVVNEKRNQLSTHSHWLLPAVVRHIKPSVLFERSALLSRKSQPINRGEVTYFCYPYRAYHQEALRMGEAALVNGLKLPWLEQYDG